VTKPPVCVLGLGLIGGSVMRAAAAAGREVFGYNRSVEGAQAAAADGFDATENIEKALKRAAKTHCRSCSAVSATSPRTAH
jgi:prephenate dehydrogenase